MWLYSIYKLWFVFWMWQKLFLIHHLLLVEEQSQQSLLIHQALSRSNTSVCPHIGFRCSGKLTCTSRHIHTHTRTHSNMPLSRSFSSCHAAPVISVSSVWHANEVSVLMLEHYRYVCLIPLLPFLFLEIILFLNGIGIFRFPQLLLEPAGWSNSQPTFQSLIPTPLPFKCFQQYDSWLEQPLFASLYVCLCECARYDYTCNGSECTHEYVF